jgi:hypothetical protein
MRGCMKNYSSETNVKAGITDPDISAFIEQSEQYDDDEEYEEADVVKDAASVPAAVH